MRFLLPLIVALALMAAVFRDDTLLTLVYFVVATGVASAFWSRRALQGVEIARDVGARAFIGDRLPMTIRLRNTRLLPVPWLQAQDSLPVEVVFSVPARAALWLGPFATAELRGELQPSKRGYYALGPLTARSGDLFGLVGDVTQSASISHLTVFPRVVPLTALGLPSRSPLGTLRHTQPLFEDPTRPRGNRDYVSGDSLRRVDWKASAATGKLQARVFEPAVSLETVIALDLRYDSYPERNIFDASELGIVAAASIATWVSARGQPVGLLTNAIDPASGRQESRGILPRKGRAQLTALLETLGRAQLAGGRELGMTRPIERLLEEDGARLAWGTTLAVITPRADDVVAARLSQLARVGLNVVLVLSTPATDAVLRDIRARGKRSGFEVWQAVDDGRLFEAS